MKSYAVIGYQNGQAGAIFPVSRETFPHNESLLIKLFWSRWLDIGLVLFCVCVCFFLQVYGPQLILVHEHAKN